MIIANPIYDVVFKYLLEDKEIARGLLSTIIGEEIEELTVQPQEMAIRKIQTQEIKTALQKVLRVFNQKFKIKTDKHKLDFQENTDNYLVQKMLDRLNRAITSDEILKEMDVEDEVDKFFGKIELQLEQRTKQLAESKEELEAERQKVEAERQKTEAERQKAEAERQKAETERQKNQDLEKQLAELKKLLGK